MNKTQTQKEITQLKKELENPERTEQEKTKIRHWIGVLAKEVEEEK